MGRAALPAKGEDPRAPPDYSSQVPAGRAGAAAAAESFTRGLLGAVVEGEEKMASKVDVVLRPVKSIAVRFCPFEPNVESTR